MAGRAFLALKWLRALASSPARKLPPTESVVALSSCPRTLINNVQHRVFPDILKALAIRGHREAALSVLTALSEALTAWPAPGNSMTKEQREWFLEGYLAQHREHVEKHGPLVEQRR
jgi:hypothetical protein